MKLYEILVPCQYNDGKFVSTRHHRAWDEKVRRISNGLTVFKPGHGTWSKDGTVYLERVIPVRIACTDYQMQMIVEITQLHYEQLAVMYYVVSDNCHIAHTPPRILKKFQRKNLVDTRNENQ